MKNLYIIVSVVALAVVVAFFGTFFVLDILKHQTLSFDIKVRGYDAGQVKIDRYITEERVVYRSTTGSPYGLIASEQKVKLAIDTAASTHSYAKTTERASAAESVFIDNKNARLSYLSVYGPYFLTLDDVPVKKDALPFDEDAILTLLPFLERYDFRRGRAQGFNAIKQISPELPPMNTLLTLTSIRDDILTIDHRKIKTECLLLKIKHYRTITIWVSKLDRSIVMLEMPEGETQYIRSFRNNKKGFREDSPVELKSDARQVFFQNKNVRLSGKYSVPSQQGKFPAVLLICGPGPYDCDYFGLFADIADYLSKNNYCVLRFDKRGTGQSEGELGAYSEQDELSDISTALEYLLTLDKVDANRVFLIGHSLGGYYALKIAALHKEIRGCVVMAMPFYPSHLEAALGSIAFKAQNLQWERSYTETCAKSIRETYAAVENSGKEWLTVLDKKCFAQRMREELNEKLLLTIAQVMTPVLLLHGNKDLVVDPERSKALNKLFDKTETLKHSLVYFGYLDHSFGIMSFDGKSRMRVVADSSVLGAISGWLADTCAALDAPQAGILRPEGTEDTSPGYAQTPPP